MQSDVIYINLTNIKNLILSDKWLNKPLIIIVN